MHYMKIEALGLTELWRQEVCRTPSPLESR